MRYTRGLTLIEMSVALLVGAIIAFAAMEIFFSARTVYGEQTERARQQENLRFSSFFSVYVARLSGYRFPPERTVSAVFPSSIIRGHDEVDGGVIIEDNQYSYNINNLFEGSDVVAFSYQGRSDNLLTNCHGTAIENGQYALDAFYIGNDGALKCSAMRPGLNQPDNQPLTTGIVGLEVLYGEDVTGDQSVNRYVPLSAVADFSNVLAVRLQICAVAAIQGDTPAQKRASATEQAAACGTPIDNPENWLMQTVALRNVLP